MCIRTSRSARLFVSCPWPHSIFLLAVVLLTVAAPAAAQWSVQSPVPTHLFVSGVGAPSPGVVFVTTADNPFDEGGALFHSVDGGASWVQRDVPFSLGEGLGGIFFLDGTRGWLFGNTNYRTLDGGTTWEELPLLGSAYFMEFYTANFGLTTGNFGAFVSLDGGLNWIPSPQGITAYDFADDLNGLGAAETGIYRTTDGATFSLMLSGNASAVAYLSTSIAVAIVDDAFVRTTDGGLTWTSTGPAEGRSRLFPVSGDIVLASGRAGTYPDYDDRLFRSADAGQTWTDLGEVMDPGPFAAPFTFALPGGLAVVASDGAGGLYHSPDGGLGWIPTFTSPGPVPGLTASSRPSFSDPDTGYFGYGGGFLIKTTDGGQSWQQLSSGTSTTLNDMDRFPNGDLIAVGETGEIITSVAGGTPWLIRGVVTDADLEAVQVLNAQDVVAVDRTGVLHKSSDAGATWSSGNQVPVNLAALDLHFESLQEGWIIGAGFNGAALFRTLDGGNSWVGVTDFQGGYFALDFVGPNGWAAANNGTLQRTTDGGVTWTESLLPGFNPSIQDLDFFDAQNGYAVGGSGLALRTSDGGLTWQELPIPTPEALLKDIYLPGPEEIWVSTAGGVALYSATGGWNWAVMDAGPAGFGSYSTIVGSPAGDAWMAGTMGTLRRFTGPPPPPVNQPPLASFDFLTVGLSVSFTDTSIDNDGLLTSWVWDFGDGTSSTERHPTHVFPAADTYTVVLTVTDDDGDSAVAWSFIAVEPGPGGTFGDFTEVTPLDPLFVTPQNEDFWVTSTAPADYDSDGDLDMAVFGFYVVYHESAEHMLVLIRNDGPVGPGEWEFSYIDVPLGTLTSGASDMAWGDADGDGDQDLVVGSNNQTVLYRNETGTLVPTDTVLPAYWEDNDQADFDLRSISWADFDNDGDLDLLLPSVWDGVNFEFRTALMRNDGANGSGGWIFSEVPAGLAPTAHAQSSWADFDGDQDLDLLLVHLAPLRDDGFIRRYRNDGGGVFVGEDVLGSLTVEHGEAQWGDYDLDGDLDILVAGHIKELDGTFNTVLRIYQNQADSFVPLEVLECLFCEGWWDITAATWADQDSDGDVDILLAGSYNSGSQIEGRAKIYDNTSGVFTDSGNQLPAPRASGDRGGSFSWLDLDGDGDLDYFIAGEYFVPGGNGLVNAQMHVYLNDAPGQNQSPSEPTVLGSQVDGVGNVLLWWNPASDDTTPADALTYDLRVFLDDGPPGAARRLPEPGLVTGLGQWSLSGLPEGHYTWTLQAVDSAFNGGSVVESTFVVGDPPPQTDVFADGFESGELSRWTVVLP